MPVYATDTVYGQQYMPIATSRVSADSAASVATVSDLTRNINNFSSQVCNFKVISEMEVPPLVIPQTTLTADFVKHLGKFYVPSNFDSVMVYSTVKRSSGAGTNYFQVIFSRGLYRGYGSVDVDDRYFFDTDYTATLIEVSNNSCTRKIYQTPINHPGEWYYAHLLHISAASTESTMYTLDIQLHNSTAV